MGSTEKAPAIDGRGKLSRAGVSDQFGPSRSAFTGRAEHPLVAEQTSWVLLISAKNLLVEAQAPRPFDLDQTFEPRVRNRRPTIDVGGSEDARSIADLDGGGEVAKACDIPKLARMASTGIDHFVMAITWRRPFRDGNHIGRPKQGLPIRRPPLGDYRRVQP